MKHKVFSPLGHSLPYRDQKPGYMLCFLDSVHCNSLYSQVRISRKGTLHKHGFLSLQEITIYSLHVYGVHRRFFFSLPYGSDTLAPPSHQYSCNSPRGPLYMCRPHSCLDSVCHSTTRTYRSVYNLYNSTKSENQF